MTELTLKSSPGAREFSRLRSSLRAFGETLVRGLTVYTERRARTDEINRLNAMSDRELAAMGVKRDRIVQYVFRDVCFY